MDTVTKTKTKNDEAGSKRRLQLGDHIDHLAVEKSPTVAVAADGVEKWSTPVAIDVRNRTSVEIKVQAMARISEALSDFIKDKNNVHGEIRRLTRLLQASSMEVEAEVETLKQRFESKPKPKISDTAEKAVQTMKPQKKKVGEKRAGSVKVAPCTSNDVPVNGAMKGEWKVVSHRKTKETKAPKATGHRAKKQKPDALLISKQGEATYADILRKLKQDEGLKSVSEHVSRIRRTQKGEMLLELTKSDNENTNSCRELVASVLDGNAAVKSLSQEVLIECKDLDDVTTKKDVYQALISQFGLRNLEESAVRSIRKHYGGTQVAVISLPFGTAKKVLEVGKIKVGWVVGRLREVNKVPTCFKCLEVGHIAKFCKNVDRSKLCRRCAEEGHIARNCTNKPKCLVCTKDRDHIFGGTQCPKSKQVPSQLRK